MMTLMRFIKKKSCHPLLSSILVQDDLDGDADDIEMPIVKQKWKAIKKKI
jgi:hypothetical protein